MNEKKEQELIEALIEVQSKLPKVLKDEENPFYKSKYTPLDKLLEKIKPILNANKLFLTQILKFEGDKEILETRIYHSNGAFISSMAPIKIKEELQMDKQGKVIGSKDTKNDPQKYGSAITYMRRYSLGPLLGIAETEDDDGNRATGNTVQRLAKIVEEDQSEVFDKANRELELKLKSKMSECTTLAELEHFKFGNKKELNKLKKYAPSSFELIKEHFEKIEEDIKIRQSHIDSINEVPFPEIIINYK
ncbi:MAG: recombination protein [Phage 33_17]|nr:MAG: recombination protein [Phage 33_17]